MEDGKFYYKHSGKILQTSEMEDSESKWIFMLSTSKVLWLDEGGGEAFQFRVFSSSSLHQSSFNGEPNQPVRTCILKVDLKCCTGCVKKSSEKLQSISGVKVVEYNSSKGLMKVTGDVDPEALAHKLTKPGKKAVCLIKLKLDNDDDDDDDNEEEDEDLSSH